MATLLATTINVDSPSITMGGTTNAEGIRMQATNSTTYPVFLRSINPSGGGETSPWIYKEAATDWGIWHNNPVNSIDFTKNGSGGIASNVGGSSTNTVTARIEMATGYVQTIAGYRNSAGTTILDNSGNITGNAATATNVTISNLATQQVSISLAAGAWYTIAANDSNRASAKFTVTDTSSGLHQAIHFYATAHYGNDSGAKITVVSNTYYGGPPVSAIRIMRGSTYDGAMVQIYALSACNLTVSIYDNQQSSGWVIKSGVVSTTNPGTVATFASLTINAAQVDLSSGKSFSVSDDIYLGVGTTQYKALHTNSTLTAGNLSGTIPSAVLGNSTHYIGTTAIALNRASTSQSLTGVSIDGSSGSCTGNAASVTDGMYLSGTQTITGIKYFLSNLGASSGTLDNPPLQVYASGTNSAFMSFHRGGSYAVNMGLDSDNILRIGGWSASANRLQLDMNGHLTVAGNMYASFFYDSDNNSYYANPSATSNFNELTLAGVGTSAYGHLKYGGTRSGDWQSFTNIAGQINVIQVENIGAGGHTNYPTGVYSYGAVMSWRTANHSFQLYAAHTGDLAYKTQWQNDNYSGWRRILDSATYPHAANMDQYVRSTDSPTFADLSITGAYQIRSYSPTITFRDIDHRTGFIHVNSNIFYILTGAADSGNGTWSQVANSRWPLEVNLSNNNATFGGIVDAISFTGAGTGLTGTAASLSIGGNAATATSSPFLSTLGNYVWSASTLPTSFDAGIQCSFVQGADGWQSYGSVMTMRTYSAGGGSLQLFVPYSPTYGGNGLQVRFGNYDVSSGNSWTSWKTLLASDNYNSYSPTLTGTGASGSWGISITGSSASCTGNAASATYANSGVRLGVWDATSYLVGSTAIGSSGGRAVDLAPNTYQQSISFEFKNGSFTTIAGNYAGLITIAPWVGTTASTGDSSYQMLFSSAAANSTAAPVLRMRAGIDTTWGSWVTLLHSSSSLSTSNLSGTVSVGNGGTGATTFTTGRVLLGNGTTDITTSANLFYNTGTNRLGVGTTTPGYTLDVGGACHASSFPTSSDIRFKKNIQPLTNALQTILSLRGVKYEWNNFIHSERPGYELNAPVIGMIAQEVEDVIPEIVGKWILNENFQDARSLEYQRIIPYLIEAVKELDNKNKLLEARILALENK